MFRILTAAVALLSLSTGCTPLVVAAILIDGNSTDPVMVDGWESNTTGVMRGVMPEAGQFDRELKSASVWRWEDSVDFDFQSEDGTWAMLGGGYETQGLEPGESIVLEPDQHWVFGCSGPQEYNAVFDQTADEVEISKELVEIDGQMVVEIRITASFGEAGEVTAVVVEPQPNSED